MKLFHRAQQSEKPGKATASLRATATVAALIAVPAALHAFVPTTLTILQVFLDVCQFCISVLRICGM